MDDRIAHEITRLIAERDAYVNEANGRVTLYNNLIARWGALVEPTITQGEEPTGVPTAAANGTGALPVDTSTP